MVQVSEASISARTTPCNPRDDANVGRTVQNSNLQGCTQVTQGEGFLPLHTAQAFADQDGGSQLEPPVSLPTKSKILEMNSTDEARDPREVPKKNTRNRMTYKERQSFMEQCVTRYRDRRSTKLIAYELGARESEVKQVLFGFMQKHPDQIAEPKVLLATPNTRMKDICGKNNGTGFYEVECQEDGSMVCKPLACSSPTSSK